MPLNFGDVAGALGKAVSGVSQGMVGQQHWEQEMALRQAMAAAQKENLESEAAFRTSEGARQDELTKEARAKEERRRLMVPSLVHQYNQLASQLENEATLPEHDYDQYDPDYLQQQMLRLEQGIQGAQARKYAAEEMRLSRRDQGKERLGAHLSQLENIIVQREINNPMSPYFGQTAEAYIRGNPSDPLARDWRDTYKAVHSYDPYAYPEPSDSSGRAKPGIVNPATDNPAQQVSPTKKLSGWGQQVAPGSAPAAEPTGAASETGQPSSQQPQGDLTSRRVTYAQKLVNQGIDPKLAIKRAQNEVQ